MHYEVPSLSSMLYEFTNKEQDSVINAFRANNYFNIRDLPNHLSPNNVLQQLQANMNFAITESSIISQHNKQHMDKLRKNGGFFERFEWMPEGYGQMKELTKEERIHNKIMETNLHD